MPVDNLVGRAAGHLLVDRRQRVLCQAVDLVHRAARRPHRQRLYRRSAMSDVAAFVAETLGHEPQRPRPVRARADPSQPRPRQLRAARVPRRPGARPGHRRLALRALPERARRQAVAAATMRWSRARPAPRSAARSACRRYIRLGKQAREDDASQSDNVVGDVVEALIGALFLDGGLDAAERFIRTRLGALPRQPGPRARASQVGAPGAGRGARPASRRPMSCVGRSGAHHAPRFTVRRLGATARRGRGRRHRQAGSRNRRRRRLAGAAAMSQRCAASSP